MEYINSINNILQITFINIYLYMVLIKIIDYKHNNKRKMLIVFISSIIEAIAINIINKYIVTLLALLVVYFIHSCIISKIINKKIGYTIILTFISLTITYLIYIISVIITGVLLKSVNPHMQINSIYSLFGIICVETLILYILSKIKRFKKGFSFLQDESKINSVGVIGFAFIGITILIYSLFDKSMERWLLNTCLFTGIVIEFICLIIWIRRKITKYYKQKTKERTIEELENEIKDKDEEIRKISEENRKIATINHKYSNRIYALEKFSKELLSKPDIVEKMKTEFGIEFGDFQKQIDTLSNEYTKEMEEKIRGKTTLDKTGIFGIDNLIEYMQNEAIKNNIEFNVKINTDINYMVNNIINQNRLETLLGDHIKDAIIAINSSENKNRKIILAMEKINNIYEIGILDTGIEFEIETLLELGKKAITTHQSTGGSGIGFMTTFETLRETKASLIIEEMNPINGTDYTKAVKIKFDGKNEYRIYSYRAEEIKSKAKDDRIIIVDS